MINNSYSGIKYLIIGFCLVFLISCKEETPMVNPEVEYVEYNTGKGEIGKAGGLVYINDYNSELKGALVEIPESALDKTETIEITAYNEPVPLDSNAVAVSFFPEGLQFNTNIRIGIPYSDDEPNPDSIRVYYFDPEDSRYEQLEIESVDENKKIIYAYTNHFSTHIATGQKAVNCEIDYFKIDEGIGVRFQIIGRGNLSGLSKVPTTTATMLNGDGFNAWNVVSNSFLTKVFSVFRIKLMENGFPFDNQIAEKSIWMYRGFYSNSVYKAQVYDASPEENDPIFISSYLAKEDINDNMFGAGNWFSGKPLVFEFKNAQIDPDKKYYVKVIWGLTSQGVGSFVYSAQTTHTFTPKYEFNDKENKQKISGLLPRNPDSNNNYIEDKYEQDLTPNADFSAFPTTITLGGSVQFTDKSTNSPTSWSWDFGDGNSSTEKNPQHSYASEGGYTVKLTASNEYGSDSETKIDYILVNVPGEAPEADFEASSTNVNIGDNIQFTDLSTNDPTSWEWDFGDGTTSISQNPSHAYTATESYTVKLIASNNSGTDTEIKVDYITVYPSGTAPTASFIGSPTNIIEGDGVQFTDQSTNDPTSWLWDFGDGETSTSQNPTHIYNSSGVYYVKLEVSNGYGTDTETKSDYIIVAKENVGIVFNPDLDYGTLTDIDNNTYKTIQIGNQVWMAENLRTTKFKDGTEIPIVIDNDEWANLSTPSYCWKENDIANKSTYGALYNFYTINTNLCPEGWHVPSQGEWELLFLAVGGESTACSKLKEIGTVHWDQTTPDVTNETGFSAIPGGYRNENGGFQIIRFRYRVAEFWSSTYEYTDLYPWEGWRALSNSLISFREEVVNSAGFYTEGKSVRCIKND